MPGRDGEVGAGAAIVTPRPGVDEPLQGAAQVWTLGEPSTRLTVSAIGAFDVNAFAIGGAIRFNWVRGDRTALGVEAEAGFAWAAVSVPLAFRLFDETWIYTAPRLGNFGVDPLLSLPAGVSARMIDGFILRAEAQASQQGFVHWNPRAHLGAAAAYQW